MRILLLLIISINTFAQKKTINQNLNYFRYQLNLVPSKKSTIKAEFENRSYLFLARQNQFLTKITLVNKLKRGFIIGNGIVYSKATSPQDADAKKNTITHEFRPYFYLQHQISLNKKSSILSKLTEDFRFFKHDGTCYQYGNIRSRIQVEYDFDINKKFTLKAYDEVLCNLLGNTTTHFFDQQRSSIATQYNMNSHFGIELAYQNWYQKQSDGFTYLNKNIIKVTVIQKIRF